MLTIAKRLLYTTACLSLLASCTKNDTPEPDVPADYGIWLQLGSWPNTTQYALGVNSLESGTVSLVGNGANVTNKADYGIIPHNGFYYYPSTSSTNGRFSKFELKMNSLATVRQVPFTFQTGITSYAWANDTSLVLIGTNGDRNKILCSVVNSNTLSIRNVELPGKDIPAGFKYISTSSVEYVNGKLFVALSYTTDWPAPAYPKAIVAIYDYPSLTLVKEIEDARTLGMGQSDMWMSGSTVDDKGDLYMLANPGWMGTGPSAVYRIKSGTTEYDPAYFFNLSTSSIGAATVALWGIGNGQAIVKYENPAATKDDADANHIYSYAVINLGNGTVAKKLSELPLDKGEMLETVMVNNGKAYIMVNSQNGKDYVWVYDVAAGTLKPGLELVGGYDYMLRIDKLK
ncbi:DUF4374 domain-containing protein [Chitinophaga arvensicola]|uniref:DUF4374 domain-containing protein n=1 Tax=Chitinophaga arvensicola TaxID=29529 RepID=A0A1I0RPU7_9BACT|nr:DUF4374 domain-containing protein [Chitinophaga arvensicola]SEW43306.1 protein of unknown function [Chitinophaga arvensicola]